MSRLRPSFPWFLLAPMGGGGALTDCSVDSTILADNAVSNNAIQDCAIDSSKIADSAVSYQNIQSVTAARLLGRYDAAGGVVQEIALAGGLTFDSTTGTISSDTTIAASLTDSQVDSSILADSAVSTVGLQDSVVTTAKIGDTAVTTAKINNDAVTYAKIQNVSAARLVGRYDATAAGDMQEMSIAGGLSFDSTNARLSSDTGITDSTITGAKIQDGTITASDLADSAVNGAKIADSSIDSSDIADLAISTQALQDSAVTSAKLGDTSVTTAKINGDAVTYAKIQNVSAGARLLGRYDAASGDIQEIALAGGLTFDSTAGTISSDTTIAASLTDSQVDSSILADNAVSTAALQDSAVTSAELGDTSVTTTKINDDAVTFAKFQNITGSRLLGRHDTTSGDMEEISLGSGLSFDTSNDAITASGVTVNTLIPALAAAEANSTVGTIGIGSNTLYYTGLVVVPFSITVNKISIDVTAVSVGGTLDLSVFSETGQTRHILVTTASISGTGIVSTAVSAVSLSPGLYYIGVNTNAVGTDVTLRGWGAAAIDLRNVTSEPIYLGTIAITGSTTPTTFDPTALTVTASAPIFRFDA